MGAGEIVGFALGWIFLASVMMWSVLTERRRGSPVEPPPPAIPASPLSAVQDPPPPAVSAPPAPASFPTPGAGWTVVESLEGSSPEIRTRGTYLLTAWLASRGLDMDDLRPGDVRIDLVASPAGEPSTRFSVRSAIVAGTRDAS